MDGLDEYLFELGIVPIDGTNSDVYTSENGILRYLGVISGTPYEARNVKGWKDNKKHGIVIML